MQERHAGAPCALGSCTLKLWQPEPIESSAGGAAALCWGKPQDIHGPSHAATFCLLVLSFFMFSLSLTVTVKDFSENMNAQDTKGRIASIRG